MDEAVQRIRQKLKATARLSIGVDPATGKVQVRDGQCQLLSELPPERLIEAVRLMDQVVGLLVDEFW